MCAAPTMHAVRLLLALTVASAAAAATAAARSQEAVAILTCIAVAGLNKFTVARPGIWPYCGLLAANRCCVSAGMARCQCAAVNYLLYSVLLCARVWVQMTNM